MFLKFCVPVFRSKVKLISQDWNGTGADTLNPKPLGSFKVAYSFRNAIILTVLGVIAAGGTAATSAAQEKTARQCAEEWRANKAENQAKKITERAYVAQCHGAAAALRSPSQPPARTTNAAPAAPSRATTGTAPTGANQFTSAAQAKAHCGSDAVVWANGKTKIYHSSGTKSYGNTKQGAYMCERDAMAAGDRAAKNEKHQ